MSRYTRETGPMPPTDNDRMRAGLALERIDAFGVVTGSADRYGLFRAKMHGHRGPDPIILSPGVDATDTNVFSSFWIPSSAGSGENNILLGAFNSEPVLEVNNRGSKRILNPLDMTGDPDTQIWLANISLSGMHSIGPDGILHKPEKTLPELSEGESKLVDQAVYGEHAGGFDFSIFHGESRLKRLKDANETTVTKRLVRVDPDLAGKEVYLVVPYVPGRGNKNHTWFQDAVVFDPQSLKPLEREVLTKRMPLGLWVEEANARAEEIRNRIVGALKSSVVLPST